MAKRKLRAVAIELRKAGKSYSEIKQSLGVAKSTLSVWLNSFPLSSLQLKRLKALKPVAVEKYRSTMLKIRQTKQQEAVKLEKSSLLPLGDRDIEIGGLFLYWGEGGKTSRSQVSISNSDPKVLVFAKKWLTTVFTVPVNKIRIRLTLYENMSILKEKLFWSKLLDISVSQFRKVRIKEGNGKSNSGFRHGTCELVISDTKVKTRIMAGLEAVSSYL